MSESAANAFIKKHFKEKEPELIKVLETDYRNDILNKQISILDISITSLTVNMTAEHKLEEFNLYYNTFYTLLKIRMHGQIFQSLESAVKSLGKERLLFYPILIDNGINRRFLVGKTYRNVRDIITEITKSPELSGTLFGQRDVFSKETGKYSQKTNMELGHIATEDNPNLVSPLEETFRNISLLYKENPTISNMVAESLNKLYKIQAEFSYTFKNTTPEAIADISSARNILGTGYIVLTLHTFDKNQEFSRKELDIYNKFLYNLSKSIDPLNIPGSNTILDDIRVGLVATLSGKKSPTSHNRVTSKSSSTTSPKSNVSSNTGKIKPPQLRDIKGRFYSIAYLQVLLNTHLQDVISANMGNEPWPGGQRRILNYRTGRFASTVAVERLSQSRQGAITAFYSFMKNPYATFSKGGAQGHIPTRYPERLISKSIHEIAATMVGNRLRAVSI